MYKYKNLGFTIIELIVGITISIILMVSVSVFVSSGLKNIYIQQKVLEDNYDSNFVFSDFKDVINNTSTGIITCPSNLLCSGTSTGFLLKLNKSLSDGGYIYVGDKQIDKFYCQSGSENTKTKHLILKKFVPFESIGADIFSGSTYFSGVYKTNYFSGTFSKSGVGFAGTYLTPNDVVLGNGNDIYVSDTKSHSVMKFDKSNTNSAGVVVAGKGIFGSDLTSGNVATGVYLNNPTGLAFGEGKLFFSDTLNNRILYLSGSQIYSLLDSYDGLSEPTGLFYSSDRKSLFISNSGKGEILEYSSSGTSIIPNLNLVFSPKTDMSSNGFDLEFFTGVTLTNPTTTLDFSFSGFTQNVDNVSLISNKLSYSFLDNTGTGILQNFTGGVNYGINVSNIVGTSTISNGAFYFKVSLFSGSTINYSEYFPYFVLSDNLLVTTGDNTLKIVTGGLSYPTGIYFDGTNILVNDFLTRKNLVLSTVGNLVSSSSLSKFDFSIFDYNKNFDEILNTPLNSFIYNYSSNLLTIVLKYYKSYNCYNTSEKVDRTFILKKSF